MKCKVLQDFQMAGNNFKQGDIIEVPEESIVRLSAVIAPLEETASISEKPPKDKAVKSNKILKKGAKKK